eukprot:6049813-Prymnesium_polylepis.1
MGAASRAARGAVAAAAASPSQRGRGRARRAVAGGRAATVSRPLARRLTTPRALAARSPPATRAAGRAWRS